jgi:hypothetical protein
VHTKKGGCVKDVEEAPNKYFYRHKEPGEEQWVTDWSEDEEEFVLKGIINLKPFYPFF